MLASDPHPVDQFSYQRVTPLASSARSPVAATTWLNAALIYSKPLRLDEHALSLV